MDQATTKHRRHGLMTAAALLGINVILFISALRSEALAQSQTTEMHIFEVTGVLFLSFVCFMYSIFLSGVDDQFVYHPPTHDPIRRQRRLLVIGVLLLGLAIAYTEVSVIVGQH